VKNTLPAELITTAVAILSAEDTQTLPSELTTTTAVAVLSAEDTHTHTNTTFRTHHYYCACCIKYRTHQTPSIGCWSCSKFNVNSIIFITFINSSFRITTSALWQLIVIQEIIPVFVHTAADVHKLVRTDFQFILMKYTLILNQHTDY